jgi:hypothetical protein
MKNAYLITLLSALCLSATAQTSRPMAKAGETVWVVAYPVKAAKRAQYERFVHEIFWAGINKLPAADQKVLKQTRILHPTKADPDGTYPYLFIMDPVIKGADYEIDSLLKKMYGTKKAAEYYKLFTDSVVDGKYKQYIETQSKD